MQTLTSIRRRGWYGRMSSLPLSFFLVFFLFLFFLPRSQIALYARSGSMRAKTRRSAQGSAFWGLKDVPLNFRGKIPQKLKFWVSE